MSGPAAETPCPTCKCMVPFGASECPACGRSIAPPEPPPPPPPAPTRWPPPPPPPPATTAPGAQCTWCGANLAGGWGFCRRCGKSSVGVGLRPVGGSGGPTTKPSIGGFGASDPGGPPTRASGTTPSGPPQVAGTGRGPASGPPRAPPVRALLSMDGYGRFDLLALNALDLPEIVRSTHGGDRSISRAVQQRAESLLGRVVEDTEKPADIARLVHEFVRISYKSGLDPASTRSWPERAAASWGGLFFESRDPGGRRIARLADRLAWAARGQSEPPAPGALARRWARSIRPEESPSLAGASEEKVLILESVQALVDDLVERPLTDGALIPLPRLTELGHDRGPRDMNGVLSQLFPPDPDGSFVIVDPTRYPEEPRVALHRPDDARAAGSGVFAISVQAAAIARDSTTGDGAATLPAAARRDPATMWGDAAVSPQDWASVLAALQASGGRLVRPPSGDYRSLPGYLALRRWILEDPAAAPIFGAVRWKDRPLGLPLLGLLVSQRTWVPKVSTDREYLEAELNHLVSGDPERSPTDGVWAVRPGWIVRADSSTPGVVTYVLEPTTKG
jgi:hypothetical protein